MSVYSKVYSTVLTYVFHSAIYVYMYIFVPPACRNVHVAAKADMCVYI